MLAIFRHFEKLWLQRCFKPFRAQNLYYQIGKQGSGRALACSTCGSFSYRDYTTVYRCECGSDERGSGVAVSVFVGVTAMSGDMPTVPLILELEC